MIAQTFSKDFKMLKKLLADAALLGIMEYIDLINPNSDVISQTQAYKTFGAGWVKKCVDNNVIQKKRSGKGENSKIYYSKMQLVAALKAQQASQSFFAKLNEHFISE